MTGFPGAGDQCRTAFEWPEQIEGHASIHIEIHLHCIYVGVSLRCGEVLWCLVWNIQFSAVA
jgi:hypothetical protein